MSWESAGRGADTASTASASAAANPRGCFLMMASTGRGAAVRGPRLGSRWQNSRGPVAVKMQSRPMTGKAWSAGL